MTIVTETSTVPIATVQFISFVQAQKKFCTDNFDNDGDGSIDCNDSDCDTDSNCTTTPPAPTPPINPNPSPNPNPNPAPDPSPSPDPNLNSSPSYWTSWRLWKLYQRMNRRMWWRLNKKRRLMWRNMQARRTSMQYCTILLNRTKRPRHHHPICQYKKQRTDQNDRHRSMRQRKPSQPTETTHYLYL